MELLQESYCSSDDDIDEEVHSKENILVTRIFVRHVGYSSFIIFSADRQTLQYRLDEEVHSKENILVTRIFVRHVGYSSFIIFSADRQTLQYRL